MRSLVTGLSGHVGGHLARELWRRGDEVHALVRPTSRSRVLSDEEWARVVKHTGDLTDAASLHAVVRAARPDRIYHLGAQSSVGASWALAKATTDVTYSGTVRLLEAARVEAPAVKFLLVGSSEEYGGTSGKLTEASALEPLSPYGVAKLAADKAGGTYHRSYGLHVVRVRAFDHTGPGRDERFAIGSWARQIALFEREYVIEATDPGQKDFVKDIGVFLRHGNLAAVRTICDSRDMARAYAMALDSCAPDVYNVCGDEVASMSAVLQELRGCAKMGVGLMLDPALARPADVPVLDGDDSKFRSITGWKPEISLKQTCADLLEWWRGQVRT